MFNRLCDWFTRLLTLWVVAAIGVGYWFPGALTIFKGYNEWFFMFTMFGIGVILSPDDFRLIFRKPIPVVVGVAAQFLIMPALALVIARLLKLEPSLALGLILVGAVPDAMASGVISYLAQADVAFSVALTSATTLVAPLVTPSVTYLFGKMYIPIQFWPLFLGIIKMVIVPLAAGLAVKHRWGKEIAPVEKLFPTLSTLFIAFICGLVVALNKEHLAEVSPSIITGVFLLNLFGLIFGYATGKLFRFDIKRSRTLAINVAMQNAGLGAVLALKHFSAEAAIPNALFATWCIVTGSILAAWWTRKSRQLPQEH